MGDPAKGTFVQKSGYNATGNMALRWFPLSKRQAKRQETAGTAGNRPSLFFTSPVEVWECRDQMVESVESRSLAGLGLGRRFA